MKNPTINVLKGVAIALVVYGHIIQRTMVLSGQDFFSHPVFKVIYTFHMPLFVFISGYLVAFSLSRANVGGVLKARAKGLLIPYLMWGTLGVLSLYAIDALEGKSLNINFVHDWLDQMIIDPEIWFLVTLFVCSALLLTSVELQKRFGLAVFAVVYLVVLAIPFNEYGALYYIKWFYVFYAAGYFANQYGAALIKSLNRKTVFAGCLILFVFFVPYWSKNDYIYVNKMNFLTTEYFLELLRFAYRYVVGFLGIALAFFVGALLVKTSIARFWEIIGVYSLDIYLLQRYLVEGIFPRLLSKTGLDMNAYSPFFLAVFAPAVTLLAVGLCIAISKYLMRRNPLTNMLFLGQRS